MPAMVIFEEGAGVLGWANVRGENPVSAAEDLSMRSWIV